MNNICLSRFNYVTQIMGFCYYHPYQNSFWSNESLTQNYVRSNLHSCFLFLVATGYYNTIQLLEAITLHLDSVNGKPCIWEELVLCFLRLFAAKTADYEDCISCTNTQWDEALDVFSKFSSFFLSAFQENRGRPDAYGGCTIILVKTPMHQKPWQVAAYSSNLYT
jgi:hypothetical protein